MIGNTESKALHFMHTLTIFNSGNSMDLTETQKKDWVVGI